MGSTKNILLYILVLLFSDIVMSQTFSDGPMTLKVRVTLVYINDYYDIDLTNTNQEPRWVVWVKDDSDIDGSGWVNDYGSCIEVNCNSYSWVNSPPHYCGYTFFNNVVVFDHNYTGSTVPSRFDLRLEGWEDDCGSSCSYENNSCPFCVGCNSGNCCLDGDQAHSGPQEVGSNINYRDMGPPCQWNVNNGYAFTGYEYYTTNFKFAVQINSYWQMTANTNGTHVWNGYMSNDWFEPCNWNTSSVPTINKNVYIPSSATNQPIVYAAANSSYTTTGQAYCNTIEIETGADLEIQTTSGASLEVQQ